MSPLDGSKDAEQVLPVAARLAQVSGCAIVLLHAVSLPYGYGPYLLHPPFEGQTCFTEEAKQAKEYLDQKARAQDLAELAVTTEIMLGTAAEVIHAYAQQHEVDLILLCRHGYTGLKRWAMGNVAQKMTRSSNIPVLVLQKERALPTKWDEPHGGICALIGLDGSPLAESTLLPTAHLVSLLSAPGAGVLHLSTILKSPVVSKQAAFLPPEEQASFKEALLEEKVELYLKSVARQLETTVASQLNLHISWSVGKSIDIAQGLIDLSEQGKDAHPSYDLIALATHGSSAVHRWLLGSIAERVLTSARLPVLIVRPKEMLLPQIPVC